MPNFSGTQLDIADVVRGNDMRKYLATLVFSGCALIALPLDAAPSAKEAEASPTVALDSVQARVHAPGLRDEAAMILVGTALIGLAAAVRRAA
jgi:hypothetical protein